MLLKTNKKSLFDLNKVSGIIYKPHQYKEKKTTYESKNPKKNTQQKT